MKRPKISVLMPVYNGEKYLKEALESILQQTFTDFEVIIVNDASTDKTLVIAESYSDQRIRIFTNRKRLGLADNRTKALKQAKGELIAIMDADDVSEPERFAKQVATFTTDPQLVICGTFATVIDESGSKTMQWQFPTKSNALKAQMYLQFPFVHSSLMVRHAALKKLAELYNPEFSPAEDYDLCFRLMQYGTVQILPEFLVRYRLHTTNTSSLYTATLSSTLPKLLKREYKRIGLTLSLQEAKEFVLFLHPKTGRATSLVQNIQIIVELEHQIRNMYCCQRKELLQWWWYICKLCLLQVKNYFDGLVNQKQPQQ